MRIVFLLHLYVLISCTLGDLGIDTSTWGHPWTQESFSCLLKEHGKTFVIIEGFRRSSGVLPEAKQTIANAKAAGFEDVQLYHFPDKSQDPSLQIQKTLDAFTSVLGNMTLWIDVENPDDWADCDANVKFLRAMVSSAQNRLGTSRVGIYTSMSQWHPIMCDDSSFSNEMLWRPHYDGKPDNSDWHKAGIGPFGGWNSTVMKQYQGTTKLCNMNVDLNWRFPH